MKEEFRPAIDALLGDIGLMERKISETKKSINRLCEIAGEAPMFTDVSVAERRSGTSLRSDQFYGRVLTTAAREYLEMRNAANLGPATPKEIFQALSEGGFKFETKNEDNATTNIRATLRKNSSIFHRLPNNQYGLLAWYPNAKPARDDDEEDEAPKKASRAQVRPKVNAQKPKPGKEPKVPLGPIALTFMSEGGAWTTERLKSEAIKRKIAGVDENTNKNSFQGALLGLRKQGKVQPAPGGGWKLVDPTAQADLSLTPMKGAA